MKIALVMHPYGGEGSGLGRMAFALAEALKSNHPEHEFVLTTKKSGGFFWLDRALRGVNADAYLFSTPMLPFFVPKRSVVFAHDFSYLYPFGGASFIRQLVLKFLQGRALRRAAKIIAVSQFTKDEIVRLFTIAPQKIEVVYNGIIDPFASAPVNVEGVSTPFFLYAGGMKERKNVMAIVEAFALLVKNDDFPGQLVLTGGTTGAYARRVQALVNERGLEERVRMVGSVSNAKLAYLYSQALSFVFPSLLEGFGMAALEVMHAGLPVIASNTGALAEAVADAALTVNPEKPEEIAKAMERIWKEKNLREDLIARGKARAAEFSWQRAAEETLQVLERLHK